MTQTRLQYLEKVVNNEVLPYIKNNMGKNQDKPKPSGAADDAVADNVQAHQDQVVNQSTTETSTDVAASDFELKLPKYKVPTETGIVVVDKDVLARDPKLLKYMIEKHPDCFKTLPAPATPPDEE